MSTLRLIAVGALVGLPIVWLTPGVSPWAWAGGAALAVAFLGGLAAYLKAAPPRSITALDASAREAVVVVAVPAHGRGVVQFVAQGKRVIRSARSADGRPIPRGASVLVVELRRHVAVVELLSS